jgi:hypothetical protein
MRGNPFKTPFSGDRSDVNLAADSEVSAREFDIGPNQ